MPATTDAIEGGNGSDGDGSDGDGNDGDGGNGSDGSGGDGSPLRSPTRRAVLAGAAGVATTAVGRSAAASGERTGDTFGETGAATDADDAAGVTVATWNCYLGVDLFDLFDADSLAGARSIAGDLVAEARRHPYAARADAIAERLVAADADVVALQEAALVRTRPLFADGEGETVVDLLDLVTAALADRDAGYDVATAAVTTDVSVPAEADDEWLDVRLTDRVALLVREGVDVRDTRSGRYDARARYPVLGDDLTVTLRRGYCLADLVVDGAALTACSTHLESSKAAVRRRQAAELVDLLPAADGVVVGADLNSGPGAGGDAYETVTGALTDAAASVAPPEPGDTCCQPSDLRNERPRLGSRVDHVLARGPDPTAVERLGADPADRVEATVDGETVTVWPSDHAGVAATYPVAEPTPTRSSTPTRTRAPTPTRSPTPAANPASTRTRTGSRTPTPPPAASPTDSTTDASTESPTQPSGTTGGTGDGVGLLTAAAALVGGILARGRDGDED
ncbi:endonuclease/exonuclease/phosphatase family protein [Halosimplex pelagicum]|uniref:Endonuclease/exonuclease/phosphatase family protein n=1 Tax=Halosimplex pelagicum TaxID=869886 RepID=A0A7D5TAS4_9EURY|nr:endonuclease/exonuclease/phosphatase family protein [Halosimplex pelagicum]QLH80695.1 endonuclease/exonuclease/phosphatase family protein [Halosimplex pelagicum]